MAALDTTKNHFFADTRKQRSTFTRGMWNTRQQKSFKRWNNGLTWISLRPSILSIWGREDTSKRTCTLISLCSGRVWGPCFLASRLFLPTSQVPYPEEITTIIIIIISFLMKLSNSWPHAWQTKSLSTEPQRRAEYYRRNLCLITPRLVTVRIKSSRHIALQLCTTWLLCIGKTTRPNSNLILLTNSEAGDRVTIPGAIIQSVNAAVFCNPGVHLQSDRSPFVHNCSAKIAVIIPA